MTYTSPGTQRRNVITLDEDVVVFGQRQTAEEEQQRESRRLLAKINDALADSPDPEEKKLRDRMMRRLRRRDHEWVLKPRNVDDV